jgi:hypothetical protein
MTREIKQIKKYEWFVHEIEIHKLKEQLNKLSEYGWEIYQIDRCDTSIKVFFSIIARRTRENPELLGGMK